MSRDGIKGHALQRAFERCPGVCPARLIRGVTWAVLSNRNDIAEFIGETSYGGFASLYRIRLATGRLAYAIADPASGFVITFLAPTGQVELKRGPYRLGEAA